MASTLSVARSPAGKRSRSPSCCIGGWQASALPWHHRRLETTAPLAPAPARPLPASHAVARWLAGTVATRRRRLGRAVRCLAGRRTPPPSRSRRRCAWKRCPVAATAVGKRGGGGGVSGWQAPRYGPFFGECDGAATRRRDGQGSSPRSMARGSRRRCASRCELFPRAVASCPSA